jgi:hypothetical protein
LVVYKAFKEHKDFKALLPQVLKVQLEFKERRVYKALQEHKVVQDLLDYHHQEFKGHKARKAHRVHKAHKVQLEFRAYKVNKEFKARKVLRR